MTGDPSALFDADRESMTVQRPTDEANIRQRIDRWLEALRAMDLEGVMSLYAPDIVSFDIVPPLRHVGAKAKERNWMDAFALYQRPLGYEIRDLTLTVGDDVWTRKRLCLSASLEDTLHSFYTVRRATCRRLCTSASLKYSCARC